MLNIELSTLKEGGATYQVYDLEERLLEYAASIIRLVERLPATRAGNHIAAQLLRSGTSPLPNHAEAQAAESRNDFIHKLRICLKELRESLRWLKLMRRVPLLQPASQVDALLTETEALVKIFVASVRTATAKNGRPSAVGRSKFNVGRSELNSLQEGGQ